MTSTSPWVALAALIISIFALLVTFVNFLHSSPRIKLRHLEMEVLHARLHLTMDAINYGRLPSSLVQFYAYYPLGLWTKRFEIEVDRGVPNALGGGQRGISINAASTHSISAGIENLLWEMDEAHREYQRRGSRAAAFIANQAWLARLLAQRQVRVAVRVGDGRLAKSLAWRSLSLRDLRAASKVISQNTTGSGSTKIFSF